ncbi:MAG: 30S ribosomal protein S6 [Deltaproteobacteria bacterium]|nr:30S ribosomal protein S6 [Deltaproteobacteria bacterium]MBW2077559.1 30S ribosomal protein S6 [Deltaproteobacteria bacterium]MBW2309927.1 30S ribosomal protein S6 [Deltaproteobacteria bacterium]
MRRYEVIYIINPNLDTESLSEVVDKFSDIITKLKGYVVKINQWGKKKLAYEVKQFDKGYYVECDFCGVPATVNELERNLKLDDRVLQYITVKVDENVDPDEVMSREQQQDTVAEEGHDQVLEEG